jgi:hypothetical protein
MGTGVLGRRKSQCESAEAGICLLCSNTSRKTSGQNEASKEKSIRK